MELPIFMIMGGTAAAMAAAVPEIRNPQPAPQPTPKLRVTRLRPFGA